MKELESELTCPRKENGLNKEQHLSTIEALEKKLLHLSEETKQVTLYLNDQVRLLEEQKSKESEYVGAAREHQIIFSEREKIFESQENAVMNLRTELTQLKQNIERTN